MAYSLFSLVHPGNCTPSSDYFVMIFRLRCFISEENRRKGRIAQRHALLFFCHTILDTSNMSNDITESTVNEEIRRVDSFEIEKPFISDNESEDGKKDSSTVTVSSQALADYDARFLTLKQVETQSLCERSSASHSSRTLQVPEFCRFRTQCIM